jgi:hypothetical protein
MLAALGAVVLMQALPFYYWWRLREDVVEVLLGTLVFFPIFMFLLVRYCAHRVYVSVDIIFFSSLNRFWTVDVNDRCWAVKVSEIDRMEWNVKYEPHKRGRGILFWERDEYRFLPLDGLSKHDCGKLISFIRLHMGDVPQDGWDEFYRAFKYVYHIKPQDQS